MNVAVIKYNAGNTRSVVNALDRLGVAALVTAEPEIIRASDKVIFPGVGHASAAMQSLRESGLDKLIPTLSQPVLGICLGMQLMCAYSEEGDTVGMGIFPNRVRLFGGGLKVPHMGWNTTWANSGSLFEPLAQKPYFYFVHSYFCEVNGHTASITDYGQPFSSAIEHKNFFGVQFHPEKSGSTGQQLLERFLAI
jgi:glutamine amidotransferase